MTNGRDHWEGEVSARLSGIEKALGRINKALQELPCHDHDKRLGPLEAYLADRQADRRAFRNASISRVVTLIAASLAGGGISGFAMWLLMGGSSSG